MKILIGSSKTFYLHFKEFGKELENLGIEYKIVKDEYIHLYSRHFLNYFRKKKEYKKIIKEFNPDIVIADNQILFAKTVVECRKPLIIFLRGNYWEEIKLAKQTIFTSFLQKRKINYAEKIGKDCFNGATLIAPFCSYLDKIVKKHYPSKNTLVIHPGINTKHWYPEKGMKLKHPCVGLVQAANIWGKTKEMLILPKIMEAMPDVTFYWAGDGPYKDKVLPELEKCDNFKWLGKLEYPEKVRQFLTEIDVYALITGLDMTPISLLEAQLMGKPVIATNVGGVSETMIDGKTGVLIEKGDIQEWIKKIRLLLTEKEMSKEMGNEGSLFVKKTFNWEKSVQLFLSFCKKII